MLKFMLADLVRTLRPEPAGFSLWRPALLTIVLACQTHGGSAQAQTDPACEPEIARLTSAQGTVDIRYGESDAWLEAGLDDALCIGTTVRVGAFSRAALAFANDSTLRLDQDTTLTIRGLEEERRTWLDMLTGAIHFFSHRPRSLKIDTPFVNAAAEGTEFLIRVNEERAHVITYEGMVLVQNAEGQLLRGPGDAALINAGEAPVPQIIVRPRDAVAWTVYHPPVLSDLADGGAPGAHDAHVRIAIQRARKNDYAGALRTLDLLKPEERDARHDTLRAAILLNVGRVDEAEAAIDRALVRDPDFADAYAQRTILHVARNDRAQALRDADRAVSLAPASSVALIAQSYARQASFDLDGARDSLRAAVESNPDDALAFARLAEIELSFGDLDRANDAASQAARLAPDLPRTQTVRGFAHLAEIDTDAAREAFARSIALYSADPLPHLGQGLAKIRDGDLEAGRRDLEIAASLDPNNALIRSYLGKAYFEEKRSPRDAAQFDIAKQLDPNDPTPWFYDAIRKQTENRPVEALRDLEKAIELNDNRAVYRSRLLLDRDLAARGVSLARIYDDLGFERAGLNETIRALSQDPTNYSAHQALSDKYITRQRHEVARASELLQAKLFQPLNSNPVQPSLSITDVNVINQGVPIVIAPNEFQQVFERNHIEYLLSGMVGNNDTIGNEIVASGIYKNNSFSVGQFYSETDGFRENSFVDNSLYNFFFQTAVNTTLNFQVEYINRETENGDLVLRIDEIEFSQNDRSRINEESIRFGANIELSNNMRSIISSTFSKQRFDDITFLPPTEDSSEITSDEDSFEIESQIIYTSKRRDLVFGGGYSEVVSDQIARFNFDGVESDDPPVSFKFNSSNEYLYLYENLSNDVTLTAGLSNSNVQSQGIDTSEISPKIGLQWYPNKYIQFRTGFFETLKQKLSTESTIEPTQVAGFNQLFDENTGTQSRTLGIGIDASPLDSFKFGLEYTKRRHERPFLVPGGVIFLDQRDDILSAYLYRSLGSSASFTLEPRVEWFESKQITADSPRNRTTYVLPLGLKVFYGDSLSLGTKISLIHQEVGEFEDFPKSDDQFIIVDVGLGYKFPRRNGVFSLEISNAFDSSFDFQDDNWRTTRELISQYVPDRSIIARLTWKL